jgi:hypothetical protein
VRRVLRSVHELGPDLGAFDLVFCADVLVHLKDPIGALERIHSVTRGSAVICNPVERIGVRDRRPLARLDGIDQFRWWITNLSGLARMVRAAGFGRVELGRPFDVPPTAGGPWKGRRGVVRGFV